MSEDIQRGMAAKMELRETEAAFAQVSREIYDEIIATGPEDVSRREVLYAQIKGLEAVKTRLMAVVSGGVYAEHLADLKAQGF